MTGSGPRKVFSAGAVLLLHLAVIAAFATAFRLASNTSPLTQVIEISFPTRVRRPTPPREFPLPPLMRPEMPSVPVPAILPAIPSAPAERALQGAISGVGRALFGCESGDRDQLPPEARARCPQFAPGKPRERSVLLGPPPDPNSPFAKEIEERLRDARPIDRPCPPGSADDIRGLPCFVFDDKAPLLPGQ